MALLKIQQGVMVEIAGENKPIYSDTNPTFNISADFHRAFEIFSEKRISGDIHLDTIISDIGKQKTTYSPENKSANTCNRQNRRIPCR